MTISPLRTIPITPESAFDAFLRQAPKAANSDRTLRLVREVAKESIVVGAKKSVLRGIFAWVGTTLANPALGVAVAVGDLFPGDTPIRENRRVIPAINKPPVGTDISTWLAEMEKAAQLAAEITTLQQQIHLMEKWGLSAWAFPLKLQLEGLISQTTTTIQGATPTFANRLQIKAQGGGGATDTITAADVETLMDPNAPIEGSERKQRVLRDLKGVHAAYLELLDRCGSALVTQTNPAMIAALINHMVEKQAEFEASVNAILRQGHSEQLQIEPKALDTLFLFTMCNVIDMLGLAPEKLFGQNGAPLVGVDHALDVIRLEWPTRLSAENASSLANKIRLFHLIDRHVANVINGVIVYLRDLLTMVSIESVIALGYCTDSDHPYTKFRLSLELRKLGVLMEGFISKKWKTWDEIEVVTLDIDTLDRLEILLSHAAQLVSQAQTYRQAELISDANFQDLIVNAQLFLNHYEAFTERPLTPEAKRSRDRVNTLLTPQTD